MDELDLTLEGIVIRGHGAAGGGGAECPYPGGTLRMQVPHFAERGLDLGGFYLGTVNVDVGPHQIRVVGGDHTFRHVRWTDRIAPEDFTFSRCALEVGGRRFKAWLYWPHPETKPEHYQAPTLAEVIAERIEGLTYGDRCRLHVRSRDVVVSEAERDRAGLPATGFFTWRARVRVPVDAASGVAIWQRSEREGRDGWQVEIMPDGGLRVGLAFDREGEWPEAQARGAEHQRKAALALPYWRWPGEILDGRLFVAVPGFAVERGRWHDMTLSYDGIRMALFWDGVLMDEEWPYGKLAVGSDRAEQVGDGMEIAAGGWSVAAECLPDAAIAAATPGSAVRAEQLLGPAERYGAYWRPRGINTSTGDAMACFDGKRLHVLTLSDRRNHGSRWGCGACHFQHHSTGDGRVWEEHPAALELMCQEETALGTGGMLFAQGRYHVWGVVLSQRLGAPATEVAPPGVVHATSADGVVFEREPGRWLDACEPGIWFEEATGVYHLVRPGQRMESRDLVTWTLVDDDYLPPPAKIGAADGGATAECYQVFRWNDWFYIVGGRSGFWMARDIRGPFWEGRDGTKPAVRPRWDIYDGIMVPHGAVVWENRCVLVGWVVDWWWGGRLVFRELKQLEDGTLALDWWGASMPALDDAAEVSWGAGQGQRDETGGSLTASDGMAWQGFEIPAGDGQLTFRVRPERGCKAFGVTVRAAEGFRGGRQLRLMPDRGAARWETVGADGQVTHAPRARCDAEDYQVGGFEGLDGEVTVRVMLWDGVVDVSINGTRTLLTRTRERGCWCYIFAEAGTVRFETPEWRGWRGGGGGEDWRG